MARMTQSNMESYLAGRTSAMRGDRWVRLVSTGIALMCLAGAMLLTRPINDIRREEQLTLDAEIEGLPQTLP